MDFLHARILHYFNLAHLSSCAFNYYLLEDILSQMCKNGKAEKSGFNKSILLYRIIVTTLTSLFLMQLNRMTQILTASLEL